MYIFNKNGIKITGLMKDPEDERDFKISLMKTTLPKYKDWQNMMSPVKHQGQLGSCVGFAITAMKEFQEQREHKKEVEEGKKNHRDEKYYDLAEAWIYWMCKKIDPWPNKEGTSIRHAMQVLQKIGVPTEKAWPYDDKIYGEPKMWAPLVAKWSKIKSYRRIVGINDLKVALRSGPVTVGIGCYEEIYKPDYNGFIKYPKNSFLV